MMSWVGRLVTDSELFILFAENSQILLKISVSTEFVSKQPTQLIVLLNSSLRQNLGTKVVVNSVLWGAKLMHLFTILIMHFYTADVTMTNTSQERVICQNFRKKFAQKSFQSEKNTTMMNAISIRYHLRFFQQLPYHTVAYLNGKNHFLILIGLC